MVTPMFSVLLKAAYAKKLLFTLQNGASKFAYRLPLQTKNVATPPSMCWQTRSR